jgi:hypothetical protein
MQKQGRRQEAGGKRRRAGSRRQEARGGGQEAGGRRQQAGGDILYLVVSSGALCRINGSESDWFLSIEARLSKICAYKVKKALCGIKSENPCHFT